MTCQIILGISVTIATKRKMSDMALGGKTITANLGIGVHVAQVAGRQRAPGENGNGEDAATTWWLVPSLMTH